jgi:hypothetical protein
MTDILIFFPNVHPDGSDATKRSKKKEKTKRKKEKE